MPQAGAGVDGAALGTIKRNDGAMHVTYHGRPLYHYAADAGRPGRTKGHDLEQFGDGWYLVDAGGQKIESESGSHSQSNSGRPSPAVLRGALQRGPDHRAALRAGLQGG